MITVEQAADQASALTAAALASTVPHLAAELRVRGREWGRAAVDLGMTSDDDEASIILAGTAGRGMSVPGERDWMPIIRAFDRGGQFSVHVSDEGRDRYINLAGPLSPLVVRFR